MDLLADPKAESNADFSVEFCGGTHLKNTKDAAAFALISEEGIAKGVRRIICMTGKFCFQLVTAYKIVGSSLLNALLVVFH